MTLFPLGQTVGTPAALAALAKAGLGAADLLSRHENGDWGDVDAEDKATNDRSVSAGHGLVMSTWPMPDGSHVWVITEGDRSATTVLLPDEY